MKHSALSVELSTHIIRAYSISANVAVYSIGLFWFVYAFVYSWTNVSSDVDNNVMLLWITIVTSTHRPLFNFKSIGMFDFIVLVGDLVSFGPLYCVYAFFDIRIARCIVCVVLVVLKDVISYTFNSRDSIQIYMMRISNAPVLLFAVCVSSLMKICTDTWSQTVILVVLLFIVYYITFLVPSNHGIINETVTYTRQLQMYYIMVYGLCVMFNSWTAFIVFVTFDVVMSSFRVVSCQWELIVVPLILSSSMYIRNSTVTSDHYFLIICVTCIAIMSRILIAMAGELSVVYTQLVFKYPRWTCLQLISVCSIMSVE
jgi:hypothetical protein